MGGAPVLHTCRPKPQTSLILNQALASINLTQAVVSCSTNFSGNAGFVLAK